MEVETAEQLFKKKIYDQDKAKDMPKVILVVRGEGSIEDKLVAKLRSLPAATARTPFEIMLWGERIFQFTQTLENGDLVYTEGVAWSLVNGVTAEDCSDE